MNSPQGVRDQCTIMPHKPLFMSRRRGSAPQGRTTPTTLDSSLPALGRAGAGPAALRPPQDPRGTVQTEELRWEVGRGLLQVGPGLFPEGGHREGSWPSACDPVGRWGPVYGHGVLGRTEAWLSLSHRAPGTKETLWSAARLRSGSQCTEQMNQGPTS